jgi:hypothetical protein
MRKDRYLAMWVWVMCIDWHDRIGQDGHIDALSCASTIRTQFPKATEYQICSLVCAIANVTEDLFGMALLRAQ